jgi:energy-coupling factor transporter ATP-binding protein EcfA2
MDKRAIMSHSRFFLCDLQIHTPADRKHSYGNWGGRDPNPEFAKRFVEVCKSRGLDIFAVTDHNRVDWYPCLREEGEKVGVYVFPGVEVSINRCHLLILWDRTDQGFDLAQQFLSSCWHPGESRFEIDGNPRPVSIGQVSDVAERAIRHKGLVLAPHATRQNIGFFASGVCTNRSDVIRKNLIAGFDIFGNPHHDVLRNPKNEFTEFPVPWFISGDTRSFDEIAERACYIKLGTEPNLEGFRQAFLMPETRIRLPLSLEPTWGGVHGIRFLAEKDPSWPRITRVRIDGGFHNGLEFDVAPGLNAIIGGKGTGKSALIEIIRYGTEAPEPLVPDLKENLKQNFRANAEVKITFRDIQHQEYTAVRVGNNNPARLLKEGRDTQVAISRRFRPTIFGQRELQQLGDGQKILREFVALTSGESWEKAESKEKDLREELENLGAELAQIESILRHLEDREGDRADHKEKLEQAIRVGAEELLKKGEFLNRIKIRVQAALDWPAILHDSLGKLTELLPPPEVPRHEGVPEGISEELTRLAEIAETTTAHLSSEIKASIRTLNVPREDWDKYIQESSDDIAKVLADIGISDAQELTRLQRRVAELDEELRNLPAQKQRQVDLENRRASCLQQLDGIARRKSRIVEEAARALNRKLSGRVRLNVEPLADKSQVIEWLKDTLQGAGIPGNQLTRLAEHSMTSLSAAVRHGSSALSSLGCTATTAQKIVERLDSKQLRELEELPCPDHIAVEVNLGSSESELWKSIRDVSPGQRATALLALVLLSSTTPLLIDQPEDDLDNQHIYEDVVRVLSEVCQYRQAIVATHNANIPVLGDAELLIVLNADAERSRVEAIGGFEDAHVASYARQILEGGEDAFRARQRRYRPS